MGLHFLPLLVGNKPVIFGIVEGELSQEERQELADHIPVICKNPVSVMLFHGEKRSKDTTCLLPNGKMIFIMGQRGAAFRRMREALPTLQKCLRNKREM